MKPTDRELAYSRTTIDQLLLKGAYTRFKFHGPSSVYEFQEPQYGVHKYIVPRSKDVKAQSRRSSLDGGQADNEVPWLRVLASFAAVSLLPAGIFDESRSLTLTCSYRRLYGAHVGYFAVRCSL
jgi:hypothetical protein